MAILLSSILAMGTVEAITSIALLATIIRLTILYFFTIRYPANLPRIREDPKATRFTLKTRLAYYIDCRNLFKEAYEKYSKQGKTCLIPGLGFREEIIIPHSSLRWLISQPDSVLSVVDAFCEMDQAKYNAHENLIKDGWQGMLVKWEMNTVLENLMAGLQEELKFMFGERFGTDTEEWKEINVLSTVKLVVAQGSSRFTVGVPLCRNEQYLIDAITFLDLFFMGAGTIGFLPKILRPFLGNVINLPIRYRRWKIKQQFKSLFYQRLQTLDKPKSDKDPQDHLQMMMRYAQAERPAELNLNDMSNRLMMANFGSFHQTSIAMTNILFNIIASDAEYNTIASLREEFSSVLSAHHGKWSKAAVAKMMKADSVFRETLRVNSFGNRSVMRTVLVDGLRTEDGILLPKGSMVSVLAHPSQCDGDIFEDPLKFDPFRFSRTREQATTTSADSEKGKSTGSASQSFVSTGPQFLPFGHGKHACPGRFLLDFELKMMFAYILLNYDVEFPKEYQGKRPESEWMAEAIMPPSKGRIRVKRRAESWSSLATK